MALSVNAAEVTLWEGEYTISGWTNGAEIAVDKVKAGDILTYTFTEAGADGAQVLIKGSDWNNMLGTAKINRTDMVTGAVTVGVTQEMIDNCGGQFFLSGDGNCVCTKITKTGEFDAKGVAAYGTRVPGVSVFTVIPEGTAKVAVEFDAVPEWAQLCDKNWAGKEFPSEASNEGKTVTYTITPEFVTAVAADKEFIINCTGANVVKVYYPSDTGSGIAGIAAENKVVNVYDLAGRVVRHNVESANAVNGLAKGIYIVNGKKVLVK